MARGARHEAWREARALGKQRRLAWASSMGARRGARQVARRGARKSIKAWLESRGGA
jgi:hypothetical protein